MSEYSWETVKRTKIMLEESDENKQWDASVKIETDDRVFTVVLTGWSSYKEAVEWGATVANSLRGAQIRFEK